MRRKMVVCLLKKKHFYFSNGQCYYALCEIALKLKLTCTFEAVIVFKTFLLLSSYQILELGIK